MVGHHLRQRQVAVDGAPGAAVRREGCRHDGALRPRSPVAGVLYRRQRDDTPPAVVADVPVAEVHPGGAHVPVVVHGLDDRYTVPVRDPYHPR